MQWSGLEGALSAIRAFVPKLTLSKHKGQAGRIAVIGGCREYTGAPFFAAMTALKVGADVVHVICTKDASPVIKSYSPELIVHPLLQESYEIHVDGDAREKMINAIVHDVNGWVSRFTSLVVGPGLGRDPFLLECLERIMRIAREKNIPMVIDAVIFFNSNLQFNPCLSPSSPYSAYSSSSFYSYSPSPSPSSFSFSYSSCSSYSSPSPSSSAFSFLSSYF